MTVPAAARTRKVARILKVGLVLMETLCCVEMVVVAVRSDVEMLKEQRRFDSWIRWRIFMLFQVRKLSTKIEIFFATKR